MPKLLAGLNHLPTCTLKWTQKNQTTWIKLSIERLLSLACPKGATIHLLSRCCLLTSSAKLLMSNILSSFSPPVGPLNRNTKDDFWTIFQHRLIYHIACRDVLSNQNLLGSTCTISNNLQREETLLLRGREKGKSRKSYQRTERTTSGDTVEQWRSRKNRPCRIRWTPVSGSKYKIYFKSFLWLSSLIKNGSNFSRHPSMFQALIRC